MMATPAPSPSASPKTSPSPRPRPRPRAATYRVQLHAGFTFDDAAAITGYLAELGVSHLYCSPVLQAAAGSTHGYDVVDHGRLNSELGGGDGYRRLSAKLTSNNLGEVLDIVPNHMALAGRANAWWWDVLENGPSSVYAGHFDIDWDPPQRKLAATVLMPVLGDQYGRVLEAGELVLERQGGSFTVHYYEHEAPISPRTLGGLLGKAAARAGSEELESLAVAFSRLPHGSRTDRAAVVERHRDKEVLRARLADLCRAHPEVAKAIDAEVDAVNNDPDALDELLREQNFRLAYWRTGAEELSYRRFFDIETLAGLRVEDETTFADTHRLILDLVADGSVDGLRVDHVDGLADPEGYLIRLRDATSGAYVVVEKILEADEELPATWPVAGTSGYEFLNHVGGLFVDAGNEAAMRACYARFTGLQQDYAGRGARGQAADHARGTGRRGGAADRPARRRLRAAPPSPRPHPPRAAGGAARDHRGLRRVPHVLPRRAPGDARRPGARGRGGRHGYAALPRPRRGAAALHRRPDHQDLPRRGGDRLRGPVPPGQCAGHGQGRGGHRVLPVPAADQPQRGGRRPEPVRRRAR